MIAYDTVIVGLGLTGLSSAKFLASQGQSFCVYDSRLEPPMLDTFQKSFPKYEAFLGDSTANVLLQAKRLLVSPGVALDEPHIVAAVAHGVEVVSDIDLFVEHARAPIVAITGSNAKSTVTTLVGAMAQAAGKQVKVGGNLGIPALDLLIESDSDDVPVDLYVIELSSFQLERSASIHAHAATILNLSEDHMDRYQGMQDYLAAKQRIFFEAKHVVFNRQDELSKPPVSDAPAISFGIDAPQAEQDFGVIVVDGQRVFAQGDRELLPVSALKICGTHNESNATAALALGSISGLPLAAMLQALTEFKGLEHRCEWVREHQNIQFFNDSKGTNVGATLAAINGLSSIAKGIVLIAGGEGKGADFSPLADISPSVLSGVVVIGRSAEQLTNTFSHIPHVSHASTMSEAVILAQGLARQGDVVLLSPACASFDMFKNYEERGRVYKAAVEAL